MEFKKWFNEIAVNNWDQPQLTTPLLGITGSGGAFPRYNPDEKPPVNKYAAKKRKNRGGKKIKLRVRIP